MKNVWVQVKKWFGWFFWRAFWAFLYTACSHPTNLRFLISICKGRPYADFREVEIHCLTPEVFVLSFLVSCAIFHWFVVPYWAQVKKWLCWFSWRASVAFFLLGISCPADRDCIDEFFLGPTTIQEIESFNRYIVPLYIFWFVFTCLIFQFFVVPLWNDGKRIRELNDIVWDGMRQEVAEGRFWVPDEEREKTLHPFEVSARFAFWKVISKTPWLYPAQFPDAQPPDSKDP